ncbi:MAG: phospho-sugar mutase [Leptospiraceae bacterium]|nr:phospho-sugar mutase [Leptospiraceae bacterium]
MNSAQNDTINAAERERILEWTADCFPLDVREEAAETWYQYTRGMDAPHLDDYLHPLQFGTGGLRGLIGNGAGRMNAWTVGRTTMGLCRFLKKHYPKNTALVIAHDSRRMSPEFAQTVAGVAAGLGLQVYLFDGVTPTPLLSYGIRHFKASGGVVITASHNPPEYNGYKVYMHDGSQMVGQMQSDLEATIEDAGSWSDIAFRSPTDPVYQKGVALVGPEVRKSYYQEFQKLFFVGRKSDRRSQLLLIYSPLHGTGGPWLPGLLEKYGFRVEMVPQQAEPDGEFPTVSYPNPEEREALKLAEELAARRSADLFLATDPDADRLGAGVRMPDGSYENLNGNQLGSIMCAWLAEQSAGSKADVQWHIMKTIVTTDLQARIAEKNNLICHDVLTGFKYIAEQMRLIENQEAPYGPRDRYLFGGEESYGYLPVDFVRDKDSLASALLLCEIAAAEGNLIDYLNQIYLKYGLYLEDLKSVTLKGSKGQARIQQTLQELRDSSLTDWTLGSRKVIGVLDYQSQKASGDADQGIFKTLPASNVIQLLLEGGGKLTIRPSGTEPKIKLYASLRCNKNISTLDELPAARKALEDELALVSGHFLARTSLT